jgi:hypothetical protein
MRNDHDCPGRGAQAVDCQGFLVFCPSTLHGDITGMTPDRPEKKSFHTMQQAGLSPYMTVTP